jgi:hypothetical protein
MQAVVDIASKNGGFSGEVHISNVEGNIMGVSYTDANGQNQSINIDLANVDLSDPNAIINVVYHETTNKDAHGKNEQTAKNRGDTADAIFELKNWGNDNDNKMSGDDWLARYGDGDVIRDGNRNLFDSVTDSTGNVDFSTWGHIDPITGNYIVDLVKNDGKTAVFVVNTLNDDEVLYQSEMGKVVYQLKIDDAGNYYQDQPRIFQIGNSEFDTSFQNVSEIPMIQNEDGSYIIPLTREDAERIANGEFGYSSSAEYGLQRKYLVSGFATNLTTNAGTKRGSNSPKGIGNIFNTTPQDFLLDTIASWQNLDAKDAMVNDMWQLTADDVAVRSDIQLGGQNMGKNLLDNVLAKQNMLNNTHPSDPNYGKAYSNWLDAKKLDSFFNNSSSWQNDELFK